MKAGIYVSKPTEIEAVEWTGSEGSLKAVKELAGEDNVLFEYGRLQLKAGKNGVQGGVPVPIGHFVVCYLGDKSDFWPLAPEAFESKYGPRQTTEDDSDLSLEFQPYIRKPFTVEALEITRENIHEISELIGEFEEDESGPYITADPEKVPTVDRVTPGYWVTKMGRNVRCYSPRVFNEQFTKRTPLLDQALTEIEAKHG